MTDYVTYPTWKKGIVISHSIERLVVRDKRLIFSVLRAGDATHDTFFPAFGVTAGMFCTWQILNECKRKRR